MPVSTRRQSNGESLMSLENVSIASKTPKKAAKTPARRAPKSALKDVTNATEELEMNWNMDELLATTTTTTATTETGKVDAPVADVVEPILTSKDQIVDDLVVEEDILSVVSSTHPKQHMKFIYNIDGQEIAVKSVTHIQPTITATLEDKDDDEEEVTEKTGIVADDEEQEAVVERMSAANVDFSKLSSSSSTSVRNDGWLKTGSISNYVRSTKL